MRKHTQQKIETVPILASGPLQLLSIPAGFHGYVRVKFLGAAAGDFMFGSWVPTSTELAAQNGAALNATNYGAHWADATEKMWDFPCAGFGLIVFASAPNGVAVVDVAGEVEDE